MARPQVRFDRPRTARHHHARRVGCRSLRRAGSLAPQLLLPFGDLRLGLIAAGVTVRLDGNVRVERLRSTPVSAEPWATIGSSSASRSRGPSPLGRSGTTPGERKGSGVRDPRRDQRAVVAITSDQVVLRGGHGPLRKPGRRRESRGYRTGLRRRPAAPRWEPPRPVPFDVIRALLRLRRSRLPTRRPRRQGRAPGGGPLPRGPDRGALSPRALPPREPQLVLPRGPCGLHLAVPQRLEADPEPRRLRLPGQAPARAGDTSWRRSAAMA